MAQAVDISIQTKTDLKELGDTLIDDISFITQSITKKTKNSEVR